MDDLNFLKEKYALDATTYLEIERSIIATETACLQPVEKPMAIIFGAQPGAGNSELEKVAIRKFNGNAAICSVDKCLTKHPKAFEIEKNYPEQFADIAGHYAHNWSLALRNYCLKNKLNVILKTTFLDGILINSVIEKMKNFNYKVDVYVLSVPDYISRISIFERYEKQLTEEGSGRKISVEAHEAIFKAIPDAILKVEEAKLYNYISLYGRRMTNLNLDDRTGLYLIAKTTKSIYQDYVAERSQKPIEKSKDLIDQKIESVLLMMKERKASENEVEEFLKNFNINPYTQKLYNKR